jgi:hypothetical protein
MQAVERTQIAYARLAGFVYLLLIVLFMGGAFLIAHITGKGDFATTSANILSSMHLYRGALVLQILASILTTLLAYALYVVVRPVDTHLAGLALCWRLGEAFVGTAFAWVSYLEIGLYSTGLDAQQATPLLTLAHLIDGAAFNITTLTFSFGSTIFFYLFFKSAYIPRAIAGFGVFASVVVAALSVSNLVLPENAASLQIAWLPIFAAEIVTGLWLLFRGVRVQAAVRHDVSGMA